MPAATDPLALFSLDVVKKWLKITSTEKDDDVVICANSASAEIEQQTNRIFVTRACSETFNGNGKARLMLRYRPVISIASLTIDDIAIDASEYVLDARLGLITLKARYFDAGIGNVVCAYEAGWDVQDGPNLPRDVYRAGLDLTKAIWDEWSTGAIAMTSVTLANNTVMLKTSQFPQSVQRVLDRWEDKRA